MNSKPNTQKNNNTELPPHFILFVIMLFLFKKILYVKVPGFVLECTKAIFWKGGL